MSLAYLLKIPTYMGEFTWSAGNGQGYRLLQQSIGPSQFYQSMTDTVSTHSTTYYLSAPLYYMAQFFQYWRGGIDITFKFVKTQMHSGRIQVTFTPLTTLVGTLPTLTNSSYALRAIIDIRTEDEVTFTLPYLAYADYMCTLNSSGGLGLFSGQVDVLVLNDLRGPESVAQQIAVQWFVKASDDFEFAVPVCKASGNLPYLPQSSDSEILHGANQGMEIIDQTIGGMKTTDHPTMHSSRCIGERVLSIKQLLLRASPLSPMTTAWSGNRMLLQPWALGACQMDNTTGVMNSCIFGGDMLSFLAPMYMFQRGSMHVHTRETAGGYPATFANVPGSNPYTSTQPLIYNTSNTLTSSTRMQAIPVIASGVANTGNNPSLMSEVGGLCYVHMPYYSAMPFSPTYQYNGIDVISDPSMPSSYLNVYNATTSSNMIVQRSVGDDYQLMFFIGCPPIPASYT
jgi:hypothetical protein